MYEKTNFDKQSVFVLTMQRYELSPTLANLFSELGDFFSEFKFLYIIKPRLEKVWALR